MINLISKAARRIRGTTRNMSEGSSKFIPSVQDVLDVKSLLTGRIPAELIDLIIDFAEYWPHILTEVDEPFCVENSSTFLYLQSRLIPGKFIPERTQDEQAEGDFIIGEGCTRAINHIRKVIFRTWSHDQGWSSNFGRGTYEGSHSWFDTFIERPLSIAAVQEAVLLTHPIDITKPGALEELQSGASRIVSVPQKRKNDDGTEEVVMMTSWHVQSNVHARSETKKHEVIWSWNDNEDANPNGPGSSGGGNFLGGLKSGDRICVVAKAQYPGWENNVDKVQVEFFYAV